LNRPGETLARLPPTRRDARQAAAHQIQIGDPATVLEIHEWKRKFNGRVREYQGAKRGGGLTI